MTVINEYEEEFLFINEVIEFIKSVFSLNIDISDFYNTDLYPFYKAKYSDYNNLVFLHFPSYCSSKGAEIRIRVEGSKYQKVNFKNIAFDYNEDFEKEVLKINNLSVEDVFQNEYYKSI